MNLVVIVAFESNAMSNYGRQMNTNGFCKKALSSSISWAENKPMFRAIIKTVDGERIDGILYAVNDSTIFYVPNTHHAIASLQAGHPEILPIPLSMIRKLTIRRKSYAGRGALTGLAAGAIGGGVIALAVPADRSGSFPGAVNNAFRVAGIGLVVTSGVILGVLLSLFPRISISFRDDITFLPETKAGLLYFAYRPQPGLTR